MITSVGLPWAIWARSSWVLPCILAVAALLASKAIASATDQEWERVRFEGKTQIIRDYPLGELLFKLPIARDFDFQRTSNWAGYTASWEVKDGALFLVSFEAKINRKDVPLDAILPGRKLPVRAFWYTGCIQIPIGRPLKVEVEIVDWTFARVVVLHIEKGKVVKTEELKNARIKSPFHKANELRSRFKLWTFPMVEKNTIQAFSGADYDKMYSIRVSPERIGRTPAWLDDAQEPPFSPLKAMLLAETKSRELARGAKFTYELTKAEIKAAPTKQRYYYEFTYVGHPPEAVSESNPPWLVLLVLMDGTVPEPIVSPPGEWGPARWAGAFDLEEPRKLNVPAPRARLDRGRRWSELSWRFRLELIGKILATPHLFYEVEKLEVYPNGVWAEYAITNASNKRKFFTPGFVHFPVGDMGLWDSRGDKWQVPRPHGDPSYREPPDFVAIDAGQTVRYRERISADEESLELAIRDFDRRPSRPAALEYFIAQWPTAFTQLTADGESEIKMFAFGYGRVPVTWFDKQFPKSWPQQEGLRR